MGYCGFEMRPAAASDNDGLLAMVRSAPMKGAVNVYLERSPDYFALSRVRPGDTRVNVIEDDDGVVGCMTTSVCRASYKGRPLQVMHWGDFRVAGSAQRSGGGVALSYFGKDYMAARDVDVAIVEMLEGNKAVRQLALKCQPPENRIISAGFYEIYQIVPHKGLLRSDRQGIRRARPDDLKEIAGLLAGFYQDYYAVPEFSADWLQDLFSRHPDFQVDDMWVVERHGRLEACSAIWDQSAIRRTVIEEVPGHRRFVKFLYDHLGPAFGLEPFPQKGKPFGSINLCLIGCIRGRERALRDLFRQQMDWARRHKQVQYVQVAFHEKEPAARALGGLARVKSRSEVYYYLPEGRPRQESDAELAATMPWLEFALV